MTQPQENRLNWHLSIPCAQVLCGLKIHLAVISMGERWQLCYWLKCPPDSLVKRRWALLKARKKMCKRALHAQ